MHNKILRTQHCQSTINIIAVYHWANNSKVHSLASILWDFQNYFPCTMLSMQAENLPKCMHLAVNTSVCGNEECSLFQWSCRLQIMVNSYNSNSYFLLLQTALDHQNSTPLSYSSALLQVSPTHSRQCNSVIKRQQHILSGLTHWQHLYRVVLISV